MVAGDRRALGRFVRSWTASRCTPTPGWRPATERVEALCRYAARPAVSSESRLGELPDGRIGNALKKGWRDGTTAVVMTNAVLMKCLCALLPQPRKHVVNYHGAGIGVRLPAEGGAAADGSG